jgi:hypothetical protein
MAGHVEHLPYKAADVIGGFMPGECLFAQGHLGNVANRFNPMK